MDSNIEFFSNVATATLADASTALGLNLIMDGCLWRITNSDNLEVLEFSGGTGLIHHPQAEERGKIMPYPLRLRGVRII